MLPITVGRPWGQNHCNAPRPRTRNSKSAQKAVFLGLGARHGFDNLDRVTPTHKATTKHHNIGFAVSPAQPFTLPALPTTSLRPSVAGIPFLQRDRKRPVPPMVAAIAKDRYVPENPVPVFRVPSVQRTLYSAPSG